MRLFGRGKYSTPHGESGYAAGYHDGYEMCVKSNGTRYDGLEDALELAKKVDSWALNWREPKAALHKYIELLENAVDEEAVRTGAGRAKKPV